MGRHCFSACCSFLCMVFHCVGLFCFLLRPGWDRRRFSILKNASLFSLVSSLVNLMLLFTQLICSEKASTSWVWIVTQVISIYLNQLGLVPLKADKALLSMSSDQLPSTPYQKSRCLKLKHLKVPQPGSVTNYANKKLSVQSIYDSFLNTRATCIFKVLRQSTQALALYRLPSDWKLSVCWQLKLASTMSTLNSSTMVY